MTQVVLKLGDVCQMRRQIALPKELHSLRYVGLEHLDSGRARLQRTGDGAGLRSTKTRFRAGDVLYGKLRPYLDKAVVAPDAGVCSTEILALVPDEARLDPTFLCYVLHSTSFREYAVARTDGVHHPRTSWPDIAAFEVALPSLENQRLVAAALSSVEESIVSEEKSATSTRELKAALLATLFESGLTKAAELRSTEFGDVNASWPLVTLSSCATIQTGVTKGRNLEGSDTVQVPYLRVANVQDGYLDLADIKTIELRARELQRYLLRAGDVLLTEGGDMDKLGRGFIWRGQVAECVHQNHIFAVRPDPNRLIPEFLAYLTQSPYGRRYFLTVAHKTTNLACINSTKLKALPVPLPTISEQRGIVDALAAVDTVLLASASAVARLNELLLATVDTWAGAPIATSTDADHVNAI